MLTSGWLCTCKAFPLCGGVITEVRGLKHPIVFSLFRGYGLGS